MKDPIMKNKGWIVVFPTVLICILLLVWQEKEASSLKSEIVLERQAVAAIAKSSVDSRLMEGGVAHSENASSLEDTGRRTQPITVTELLASIPDEVLVGESGVVIRSLPNILGLLEELTADELFVLLGDLNKLRDDEPIVEAIFGILVALVSEVEPERVLALMGESEKDDGTEEAAETGALFGLARQDPAKAEAFLEAAGWRGKRQRDGEMAVLMGWVQSDFQEAIRYLKESDIDSGMGVSVLANSAHEPKVRDQMRKAILGMEDSPIRKSLTTALMAAEYSAGGFTKVSELLSEITFENLAARDEALSGAANMGLLVKPKETIEWLKKEASPARRGEFLGNSVMRWAHNDYQAAGEWLQSQEPSSDTDQAILAYASTVVQIDPAAAMTWADEIQDSQVQKNVRKRSLRNWSVTDPDAARNWVVEQGWEVEEWLPDSK